MLGDDTWFLPAPTSTVKNRARRPVRGQDAAAVHRRGLRRIPRALAAHGLTHDDFIRTTSDRHKQGVQALWRKIRDNGFIYKGTYTGQYCVSDELYIDGIGPGDPCPDCGRPTETVSEKTTTSSSPPFRTS